MRYLSRIQQVQGDAFKTAEYAGKFADLVRQSNNSDPDKTRVSISDSGEVGLGLRILEALGFVSLAAQYPQGDFSVRPEMPEEKILPCLGLMDRIEISLLPIKSDGCPVKFCSGFFDLQNVPAAPKLQGRMIAVGQGTSQASASLSCLGEMAERLSILSRGEGDPLVVHSSQSDFSADAVIKFSEDQQRALVQKHPALAPHTKNGDIDWGSISDRRVHVTDIVGKRSGLTPSLIVLLREGRSFKIPDTPITSSNGAASWWHLEGAVERGVMELIERDAVACWWYNRLIPKRVSFAMVRDSIAPELFDWLEERERGFHLLQLATDLPCTVIAAISRDRDGRDLAYGFKAALKPQDAITGAILEMVQMEMHLQTITDNLPTGADGGIEHPLLRMSQSIDVAGTPWLEGLQENKIPALKERAWPELLDSFVEKSIPVWTVDTTRADIGVPTIKTMSPILRDWLPRFGPGRLYSLPVSLGLKEQAIRENELNPVRFVS